MHDIELRLAAARERQALLRSIRDEVHRSPGPRSPIRRQLGESLVRLGRRVAGEQAPSRVWSG